MSKHNEMTRYAFISHMEDYMKKLLTEPLKADTDEFLKGHGIDGPKALKILTMRADPEDENSSIVIKSASIKDNGYDENGKRNKDSFIVKYKIPRKDYTKKMRNLFISLFENNIVEGCPINEGAWGYGILDNDAAIDYQSKTTSAYLKKVMNDVLMSGNADDKWAKVGVLIDFLKKYKSDELQVTDDYTNAIDFAVTTLKGLLNDQQFISSWDDAKKIRSSLKKGISDVSALRYNEDIMIADQTPTDFTNRRNFVPTPRDGRLMQEEEGDGATNAALSGQFDAPALGGNVVRRKTMYITQEQAQALGKLINEEDAGGGSMEGMGGATTTFTTGNFQFTVPFGGKKKNNDDFYKEANDHQDIMKKSWKGSMEEEKSGIHIKEKNKGKFNATKARTGKSTEELTHSSNPVTRKRAIFAQNAAKWNKK